MSPSELGLSSPVGHEQGTFRIQSDAQGNKYIANGYGNAGIFSGVAGDAAQSGVTLSTSERETAAKKGPVELDHFLKLVRTLMTQPRIE